MWEKVFSKLEEKGLNPYPPGLHKGECKERYCVVKEGTQMPSSRTSRVGIKLIEVITFTPQSSYPEMRSYISEIKQALRELKDIKKTGVETPTVVDDSKKAYTASIQYQIFKDLEG